MTDNNVIKLNRDNILRLGIQTADGEDTGEVLEFDLEDIELPLNASKMEYEHRKNLEWLRNQFVIIEKKQDKQDGLLSYHERLKMEAFKEFYMKEIKTIDLLLGEGKTEQILKAMHRKPYYSMFDDITDMLEPIIPKLEKTTDDIISKIKSKYTKKEENTLE